MDWGLPRPMRPQGGGYRDGIGMTPRGLLPPPGASARRFPSEPTMRPRRYLPEDEQVISPRESFRDREFIDDRFREPMDLPPRLPDERYAPGPEPRRFSPEPELRSSEAEFDPYGSQYAPARPPGRGILRNTPSSRGDGQQRPVSQWDELDAEFDRPDARGPRREMMHDIDDPGRRSPLHYLPPTERGHVMVDQRARPAPIRDEFHEMFEMPDGDRSMRERGYSPERASEFEARPIMSRNRPADPPRRPRDPIPGLDLVEDRRRRGELDLYKTRPEFEGDRPLSHLLIDEREPMFDVEHLPAEKIRKSRFDPPARSIEGPPRASGFSLSPPKQAKGHTTYMQEFEDDKPLFESDIQQRESLNVAKKGILKNKDTLFMDYPKDAGLRDYSPSRNRGSISSRDRSPSPDRRRRASDSKRERSPDVRLERHSRRDDSPHRRGQMYQPPEARRPPSILKKREPSGYAARSPEPARAPPAKSSQSHRRERSPSDDRRPQYVDNRDRSPRERSPRSRSPPRGRSQESTDRQRSSESRGLFDENFTAMLESVRPLVGALQATSPGDHRDGRPVNSPRTSEHQNVAQKRYSSEASDIPPYKTARQAYVNNPPRSSPYHVEPPHSVHDRRAPLLETPRMSTQHQQPPMSASTSFLRPGIPEQKHLAPEPQTSPGEPCPVCQSYEVELKSHVLRNHLPWYACIGAGLYAGPRETHRRTRLADKICPLLMSAIKRKQEPLECVQRLWGELLCGLLDFIKELFSMRQQHELVSFVRKQRLYPEASNVKLDFDDQLVFKAVSASMRHEHRKPILSPPDFPAALLYWRTLAMLVGCIPEPYRSSVLKVERFRFNMVKSSCPITTMRTSQGERSITKVPPTDHITHQRGPFQQAILAGDIEEICKICRDSSNIMHLTFRHLNGGGPVHYALSVNQPIAAAVLLMNGASINQQDVFGLSPLHKAVKLGSMNDLKFILQWNPRLDLKNNSGITALQLAEQANKMDMVRELKKAYSVTLPDDADPGHVPVEIKSGHLVIIPKLVNPKSTEVTRKVGKMDNEELFRTLEDTTCDDGPVDMSYNPESPTHSPPREERAYPPRPVPPPAGYPSANHPHARDIVEHFQSAGPAPVYQPPTGIRPTFPGPLGPRLPPPPQAIPRMPPPPQLNPNLPVDSKGRVYLLETPTAPNPNLAVDSKGRQYVLDTPDNCPTDSKGRAYQLDPPPPGTTRLARLPRPPTLGPRPPTLGPRPRGPPPFRAPSVPFRPSAPPKTTTGDLKLESICPICKVFDHPLKVHVITKHLPWYVYGNYIVSNQDLFPNKITPTSRKMLDSIFSSVAKSEAPPLRFNLIWGELLHGLLEFLKDQYRFRSVDELLGHVKTRKLFPNSVECNKPLKEELLMFSSHQQFLGVGENTVVISPPSRVTALLHWRTLANLIGSLPQAIHREIFSVESLSKHCTRSRCIVQVDTSGSEDKISMALPGTSGVSLETCEKLRTLVQSEHIPLLMKLLSSHPSLVYTSCYDCHFPRIGGASPVMFALSANKPVAATVLMTYGASPDQLDDEGWTPLQRIVSIGKVSASQLLVQWGANPLLSNPSGETASQIAKRNSYDYLAQLMDKAAIEWKRDRNRELNTKNGRMPPKQNTPPPDAFVVDLTDDNDRKGNILPDVRCVVCPDKMINNVKSHAIKEHLPWYIAPKYHDVTSESLKDKASGWMLPKLLEHIRKNQPLNANVVDAWGSLLHGLLDFIAVSIGLKSYKELFLYAQKQNIGNDKRYGTERCYEVERDDYLMMEVHGKYINADGKRIAAFPPNCLSALLHWPNLLELIDRVPDSYRRIVYRFESRVDPDGNLVTDSITKL